MDITVTTWLYQHDSGEKFYRIYDIRVRDAARMVIGFKVTHWGKMPTLPAHCWPQHAGATKIEDKRYERNLADAIEKEQNRRLDHDYWRADEKRWHWEGSAHALPEMFYRELMDQARLKDREAAYLAKTMTDALVRDKHLAEGTEFSLITHKLHEGGTAPILGSATPAPKKRKRTKVLDEMLEAAADEMHPALAPTAASALPARPAEIRPAEWGSW